MVTERTRVWLELIGSVLGLVVLRFLRNRSDDSEPPSRRWMIAGFVSIIPYSWAFDHNWHDIKNSRWRNGLLTMGWSVIQQFLIPENESAKYGFSIGMLVGGIVYRLWSAPSTP